jgi:hypothetical protein
VGLHQLRRAFVSIERRSQPQCLRAFAQRQTQVFEADLKKSRRITYQDWQARPLMDKVREHFFALFGALL